MDGHSKSRVVPRNVVNGLEFVRGIFHSGISNYEFAINLRGVIVSK